MIMQCSLCGHALDDAQQLTVPTTDGGYVHVICADRAARAAYAARTIRALISAALLLGADGLSGVEM
jgi:hypothetical protein